MSGGTDDIGGPFTATYDAEPAARTRTAATPPRRRWMQTPTSWRTRSPRRS